MSAPPPAYNPQPLPQYQPGQPAAYPPPGQPAGAYPPPGQPAGAYPPPGQPVGAYPPPGQAPVTVQQPPTTTVVVQGGAGTCGQCGVGYRTESYTTCGIILAICFFPLGIICCLLMKEAKCSHCGQPM